MLTDYARLFNEHNDLVLRALAGVATAEDLARMDEIEAVLFADVEG